MWSAELKACAPIWKEKMASGLGEKHAFLVGGTYSGCGKTTITLGLLAALKARGLSVQPYKVGPDFIDPGLHTQIAGMQSRNLDGWMLSRSWNAGLFRRLLVESDVGLIEGVMGLFDGYEGRSESGSSAEMAKWLGVPGVLVVDARSMARSAAALIYGFTRFDPGLNFAGLIFNRIGGEAHLEFLKEAVAFACPEIAVLGGIPREDTVSIPERHLGLVTADEMRLDARWQKTLAELLERRLDIDLLIEKTRYPVQAVPAPLPFDPVKRTQACDCGGARRGFLLLLSRQPGAAGAGRSPASFFFSHQRRNPP